LFVERLSGRIAVIASSVGVEEAILRVLLEGRVLRKGVLGIQIRVETIAFDLLSRCSDYRTPTCYPTIDDGGRIEVEHVIVLENAKVGLVTHRVPVPKHPALSIPQMYHRANCVAVRGALCVAGPVAEHGALLAHVTRHALYPRIRRPVFVLRLRHAHKIERTHKLVHGFD